MKRIIALVTALLLLSNIFVFTVSAAEVNITSVTYPTNKTSYAVGDTVKVTGTCTTGKDIVIRIYNEKNSLIYTDVILAPDNTTGTFEFSGFQIPATKSTGALTYKVVVSVEQDGVETTNVATVPMAISKAAPPPPPPPPIPDPVPDPDSIGPWVVPVDPDSGITQSDTTNPAFIDSLNMEAVGAAAKQPTAMAGARFITATTMATAPEALAWESTRNTIAVSVETMISNISSKKISIASSKNQLVLNEKSISDSDLKKYTDTEKTMVNEVAKNKITLNRELSKEYIVNSNFAVNKKANITVYKKFVDKLKSIKIETLTINDKNFRVSYSLDELYQMIGAKEFASFDIDITAMTGTTKKLTVNFDTDKTQTVKIAFPGLKGDSKYMAIVDENGNPVGGRYNPATDAIEAKITASGEYKIVYNEKDFKDIKNKSEEMQESIKILAAKGIIEGTSEKEFSPDDTITRAEIAALLLRVLSKDDPNADGGFVDVKKSDWFYGTAGSSKNYGMIMGFEDNTFRGNVVIAKDQILTIASRVLKREMAYKTPTDIGEYLKFNDANQIAAWAKEDIALATMANIITRDENNLIGSTEDITRGDAALIIMRLFYKIW